MKQKCRSINQSDLIYFFLSKKFNYLSTESRYWRPLSVTEFDLQRSRASRCWHVAPMISSMASSHTFQRTRSRRLERPRRSRWNVVGVVKIVRNILHWWKDRTFTINTLSLGLCPVDIITILPRNVAKSSGTKVLGSMVGVYSVPLGIISRFLKKFVNDIEIGFDLPS